jgi:hypothetical protein
MLAKMETNQGKMMARMNFQLQKIEAALHVFEEMLNETDTTDSEANREKAETLAEEQDSPKEEA